ncbi:MAG TPA: cytochrome C oxidase subunit IV family protein [Thermoanaerobaculia bacterium]|nr:cytochrome C oxidase subunit IV family protein [Thermoanaerobaculia bacterium]
MAEHGHAHAHPHVHGHVTPLGVYLAIFATLMVLTVVTVLVAYVDLGQLNIFIALGIAGFKATLVVLYFMHVKYASPLTKLFAVTGIFFLAILLGLTMIDYASRMWVNPPALLQ